MTPGILQLSVQLQLGHAGKGVEICRTPWQGKAHRQLQLGHAGEGVEMRHR